MGSRSTRHGKITARKGKAGCNHGRHDPVIVFEPMGTATCHRPDWWPEIGWMCWHEERCARCGDVLRRNISETECPTWRAEQEHQPAGVGSS